jgi:hypothetical protein
MPAAQIAARQSAIGKSLCGNRQLANRFGNSLVLNLVAHVQLRSIFVENK